MTATGRLPLALPASGRISFYDYDGSVVAMLPVAMVEAIAVAPP